MYEHKPKRTNYTAKLAVAFCFAAAAIAFVGASLVPRYPSILQCIGLCLLVPVIQITARYLVLQYLYRVRECEDGSVDFEIFAYRGGSRMQLVCRVGLSEIVSAAPLSGANKKAPHGIRRYNYHPDMGPREGLVLSITNGDGDCEILLSPDKGLSDILTRAAKRPVQE